jgi:tetratricopeptide (TPR) repeat protein
LRADSVLAGSTAVLAFNNTPGSTATPWLGESAAEALREALLLRGSPVISRGDVTSAYADLRLRPGVTLTQASVLKMGQALNADFVIHGTYRLDASGMLTLQAAISDRAKARLHGPLEESGPMAELDRLEAHLAWRVLNVLALAPPEADFRKLRAPVRTAAEESFIRGLLVSGAEREKHYQQAARTDVTFARPLLELGKIELGRKNYRAAAEWLLKVPSADPHSPEATFYLGVARYRQGDFAAAQSAFERLTTVLPIPEVFNNLGAAESRRNQLHALASFREALQLSPTQPDYHFNMGYILLKTGQYDAAADRFRAVLERSPSDQLATVLLGRSLKGEDPRKAPADPRFDAPERFKDTYEPPLYHSAPVATVAVAEGVAP